VRCFYENFFAKISRFQTDITGLFVLRILFSLLLLLHPAGVIDPKTTTDRKLKCLFYALIISNFLLCAAVSVCATAIIVGSQSVCLSYMCTVPGCFGT